MGSFLFVVFLIALRCEAPQTICCLALLCVKLTFYSDFTVPLGDRRSCIRSLRVYFVNFFVRGMQDILFYNIVYAYVCKICEEKFGGCW